MITRRQILSALGAVGVSSSFPTQPAGATTAAPAAVTTATIPTATGSGVFVGTFDQPSTASMLSAFATWRGRALGFANLYLPTYSQTAILAALDNPATQLAGAQSLGLPISLGVPMTDWGGGMSLRAGASGTYDQHYKNLGAALVAAGYAKAILRVGWESNSASASWSYGGHDPKSWRLYYRRIVAAMRTAAGQRFTFDLTMANTSDTWGAMYPGDDVVDYLGIDVYDFYFGTLTAPTAAQRWAAIQTGLTYITKFAARTSGDKSVKTGGRKPITVPEFGLVAASTSGGGGDDSGWLTLLNTWMTTNKVAYTTYWDSIEYQIDNGQFPNGAAEYTRLW